MRKYHASKGSAIRSRVGTLPKIRKGSTLIKVPSNIEIVKRIIRKESHLNVFCNFLIQ